MAAILNFRIFRKIAKHKNAYFSKTVLDRAISTKFLTHWVSLQSSHANFQKNFILLKMAAILNFRIFAQKLQNTKMLIFRGATEQSTLDERGQFHENSIPILKVEYSCIYNNLQNRKHFLVNKT